MFQVSCASCAASFEYNPDDYIHLCPYCSSGFILDVEEGAKDLVGDHFIISNKVDRDHVEKSFFQWIKERYHRPEKVDAEFKVLGCYGISLPYWVISLEAHTFWSGHSAKVNQYDGQPNGLSAKFVKEEGRFSRRYRWAVLARKSPKEHWGLERLHHPREMVMVDWDGFPLDESMGTNAEVGSIYDSKVSFKFEHSAGLTVAGIQVKESTAIARARDQIQEYHRRICKTKAGTLYEYRTEIEIVGIQVVHLPFWILRYLFKPKSLFRYFSPARERRVLIQGFSQAILEAELPMNSGDKVITNLIVCSGLAFISLVLAVLTHPLFLIICLIFLAVCVFSVRKIIKYEKIDLDLGRGAENSEPAH